MEADFKTITKKLVRRLKRFKWKHEDAEDIAQNFLIKNYLLNKDQQLKYSATDHMRSFYGSFRTWNTQANLDEQIKNNLDLLSNEQQSPEDILLQKQVTAINLKALSKRQRQIIFFVLAIHSGKKAAEKLGVSASYISQEYAKMKQRLKKVKY